MSPSSAGRTSENLRSSIDWPAATLPSCTISRASLAIASRQSVNAAASRSPSGTQVASEAQARRSYCVEVRNAANVAMQEADLILFIVDAQDGLTPIDEELARFLRRSKRPVILVVNKDRPSEARRSRR